MIWVWATFKVGVVVRVSSRDRVGTCTVSQKDHKIRPFDRPFAFDSGCSPRERAWSSVAHAVRPAMNPFESCRRRGNSRLCLHKTGL